jgi:DNA polymerase-3 subunit gamma/tau
MAKKIAHTDPPPSTYTVLARRYRPQTFEELVGQEAVAQALTNALKANRVAHAYLFTGSRGVGKTSAARILAKALNCEKGPTPVPCGECGICRGIASGDDVDVLEIDGASNRRIDEVRDIRSNIQFRPARARYKIYIIDEVHMLTKEAFNALLKTLEEPPGHVKFIFATTEVDKVPITILSRCQRFDFSGIPLPRIVERLRTIVESEGLQAEDEALELVARRAAGSMRDGQSLLDQLLAFGGENLTVEQVHALLGTAGDDRIVGLAEALVHREPSKVLELLDDACVAGLQLGELVEQLIAYWRDLMVVHCAGTEGQSLSVPSRLRDTLAGQAKVLPLDTILAGLDILSLTKARLRGSSHARTLVEMALVRLCRLEDLVPLSQLTQLLGQSRSAPPSRTESAARLAAPTGRSAPPSRTEEKMALTAETLPQVWERALQSLGPMQAGTISKAGLPAITAPNALVFRPSGAYNEGGGILQDPARVAQVEKALREVTGEPWNFRVETNATTLPEEGRRSEPPPGGGGQPRRNYREEAEKLPLIRRAMDRLGATIQRVEEGFGDVPPEQAGSDPKTSEEKATDV